MSKLVTIADIAEVNPRLSQDSKPGLLDMVSFVPMAAVSELSLLIVTPIVRPYGEVAKGFTSFKRGDILIAKITPCFENGKMVHVHDLPCKQGFGSTEFHVLRPSQSVSGSYLFHLLRDPYVRRAGASKMKGAAGQRRVPSEFFANLQIPLPPLDEQKRIAAILDAADALRTKRREALAELDSLVQATFIDMFGDPITNPKGWEIKPLEELGSLNRGVSKHRPRNEPSLLGGAYPLIQTGDVANSNGYIRTYNSTYSDKGLQQSKMWPAGTLCITIAANIANTGLLTFDACFPDSVVGFLSDIDGRAEYVQGLFWFFKDILEKKAPQVAQKNINLKILRDFPVPFPPLPLQHRFADIVKSIEKQKALHRKHLAELDTLFAALQQRAFNGELST